MKKHACFSQFSYLILFIPQSDSPPSITISTLENKYQLQLKNEFRIECKLNNRQVHTHTKQPIYNNNKKLVTRPAEQFPLKWKCKYNRKTTDMENFRS